MKKTYEDGLNDAWEVAKQLFLQFEDGGLTKKDVCKIFDDCVYNIFQDWSIKDVLEKMIAYKEANNLNVEEIVSLEDGTKGVLLDNCLDGCLWKVFSENGCVEEWHKSNFKKTGRKINGLREIITTELRK